MTGALEKAGHIVHQFCDCTLDGSRYDVIVALGEAIFREGLRSRLERTPKRERPLVVAWHFDPLPPPRASGLWWPVPGLHEFARIVLRRYAFDPYTNYVRLRDLARSGIADLIAVSSNGRVEFLAERGITAYYAPLGYFPELGHDLGIQRDLDVLFLGDLLVGRRRRIVRRLRKRGVPVQAVGDFHDPAYWGENRTRLLNRTKIFLNIPRFRGEFAGMRMALAAANKTMVISEPLYWPAPFVPGRHFISAELDEMPDAVAWYLEHEEERERIAAEAHRLVVEEFTLERSVRTLLGLIQERLGGRRS